MSTDKLTYEVYNKNSFVVRGDRATYGTLMKKIGGRWNSRLNPTPGWTILKTKEDDLKKLLQSLSNSPTKELEKIESGVKSRKEQNKYHRAVSESKDSDDESDHSKADHSKKEINKAESPSSSEGEPAPEKEKEKSVKTLVKKVEPKKTHKKPHAESSSSAGSTKSSSSPVEVPERKHRRVRKPETSSSESPIEKPRRLHPKKDRVKQASSKRRNEAHRKEKPRAKGDDYYKSFSKKPSKFRALYEPSDDEKYSSDSGSSGSSSSDDFPLPESPKHHRKSSHRDRYRREPEDYGKLVHRFKDIQKQMYERDLKQRDAKPARRRA